MIRVLHSVSNMDRGGIETMLMNYYRHIDREKVQFDFIVNKKKPGDYDDSRLRRAGGLPLLPRRPCRNAGAVRAGGSGGAGPCGAL